jgi:hypothetical protein
MLDEYLNYLQEFSLPGKCNRLKNKIKFHRDELKEEYVNLKKCKTYWLGDATSKQPMEHRKKYYKKCVMATKEWIKKRKDWVNETEQKYRKHCR